MARYTVVPQKRAACDGGWPDTQENHVKYARIVLLIATLSLTLGALVLAGCSSSDDGTEGSEPAVKASTNEQSNSPLAGTWKNVDAHYYPEITFAEDGTGTIADIDGEEATMDWTLVDDYLEIVLEFDGETSTSGGGFTWNEEGAEFSWDADGVYSKSE